jgi:FlaA1/EpsC-like NDP-sugar epimerase
MQIAVRLFFGRTLRKEVYFFSICMRIRRLDLTYTALLVPLDILALFWPRPISAYLLRYSRFVTEVRPILQDLNFTEYITRISAFIGVWIILFALAGLYSMRMRRAWNEFGRIILACGAGTMVVIATVFFRREITTSRFIVLAVLGFSILYVWLGRLFLRTIRHTLLQAGIGHRHVIVIGTEHAANSLVEAYSANPILGITVVSQFSEWNDKTRKAILKFKEQGLDGILLADPELKKASAP